MNTLNSKTSESNKFIYQFTEKLNLKNPNKNMALANLSITIHRKTLNLNATTINLRYMLQLGMMNVICLMDLIVSGIKDYFEYIIKRHETIADNPPVQIYVNKIKNKIVFKTKTGYKLELLTEETMLLLGSSKKAIDRNKDGEIVPRLEAVKVVLVHCNLINNSYLSTSTYSIIYFCTK